MEHYVDYYEARQHLNLSDVAFEIIESDKTVFLEKASRQRIINTILRNYMDDADASIDIAAARYAEGLRSRLVSIADDEKKNKIISALVDAYRNNLIQIATHYPNGHSFKMQLDKENFETMLKWKDNGDYYKGKQGRFLKAVIEEYARKTQYEREGILLRETIEDLQSCIDAQQLVVITLNGSKRSRHEIRPYMICCDSGCNYHYLVGMARMAGTSYPERIASYRISRIVSIRRSRSRSGKITATQAREIAQKLRDNGVQFLLQDSETILVRLTGQGKRKYDSQAHLRPFLTECKSHPDGSWLLTFDCTQMQAEFYFFKFGADAIIESPLELRDIFLRKYQDAVEQYNSKGGTD